MAYGKGLVSDNSMNQHKEMAQGKTLKGGMAGSVGSKTTQNPSTTGELSDAQRACSSTGGMHGQQSAPDHGAMGSDHHRRGGLL